MTMPTKAEVEALCERLEAAHAVSDEISAPVNPDGREASTLLRALTEENEQSKTLMIWYKLDAEAAEARAIAAEEALKHIQTLKRSIMIDVGSCHSNRGPAAELGEVRQRLLMIADGCAIEAVYGSEWCAFPDVEFRKDLRAALAPSPAPQASESGEEV